MSVKRTLSEIRATCTKAARGAGCPWGLAEEAGIATRLLHAHDASACETLATLFTTPRACACDGKGDAHCGIALAATLSDDLKEQTIDHPVAAPLLLLSPLLQSATDGTAWQLDWGTGKATCSADGLTLTSAPPAVVKTITIRKVAPENAAPQSWHSRPVDQDAWDALQALAAKTYVPETAQSRAAGAGPADSQDD